jgi:hypothetical protein
MADSPTVVQNSFGGGVLETDESPDAFSPSQMAIAKGLVIETSGRLRTQPAIQRVSLRTDLRSVLAWEGENNRYLIGITTAGALVWCYEPDATAGNATTQALEFVALTGAATNTKYRFVCESVLRKHPVVAEGGYTMMVEVGSRDLSETEPTTYIYENGTSGLAAEQVSDHTPTTTTDADNIVSPVGGKAPRSHYAVMWGQTLVRGNIKWRKNLSVPALAGNYKNYPSTLLFSMPGETDKYLVVPDPNTGLGSIDTVTGASDSAIVGLQVIDSGMLVFTTREVILLRGTASAYSIEKLRDVQLATTTINMTPAGRCHFWSETGATAFVSREGAAFTTDGEFFERVDRVGPKLPRTSSANNQLISFGDSLLLYRAGRLLVLKLTDVSREEAFGAWTEFELGGLFIRSMSAIGTSIYLTDALNRCFRIALTELDGPAADERGQLAGVAQSWTFASSTFGDPAGHDDRHWRRLGVRLSGLGPATLSEVRAVAGPASDSQAPARTLLTAARTISSRFQLVLPVSFSSRELSLRLRGTGDVTFEQLAVWVQARKSERGGGR